MVAVGSRTPLFVLENQYDEEQIFGELHVPFPNTKDPESIVKLIPYLKYYGERYDNSQTATFPALFYSMLPK